MFEIDITTSTIRAWSPQDRMKQVLNAADGTKTTVFETAG